MGSPRVGHDLATEQKQESLNNCDRGSKRDRGLSETPALAACHLFCFVSSKTLSHTLPLNSEDDIPGAVGQE